MIRFFIFLLSALLSLNCYANTPSVFTHDTANYQEVLSWSKEKIRQEANTDYSKTEIQTMLSNFPVIFDKKCGGLNLLLIQNTPQCGNVNCKYLVFSVTTSVTHQKNYHYLEEIYFNAVRLFCYPKSGQYDYYLVTSEHESNATGMLNLYKIINNKFVRQFKIDVDYTNPQEKEFADSLWEKPLSEPALIKGFKTQ